MTEEQRDARRRDREEEGGHIRHLIDNGYVCDQSAKKDFIFISYKSDDWEKVLYEIVYGICTKYGLRVYFDAKFDDNSDHWVKQFRKNMNSSHCKAMLAFVDAKYESSYATLMELMASRSRKAGGDFERDLLVLPITLSKVESATGDENTGLGTSRFSNGDSNANWRSEVKEFNKLYRELVRRGTIPPEDEDTYERSNENENNLEPYIEATEDQTESGEMYLSVNACKYLSVRLRASLEMNEIDGGNRGIADAVYNKLKSALGEKTLKNLTVEAPRPEAAKPEAPKQEALKPEAAKPEAPKQETPTQEAPQQEVPTQEALRQEAPKSEAAKPEAANPAAPVIAGIWEYKGKDANARLVWDGVSKQCTVLKGSKTATEAAGFAKLPAAKRLKEDLMRQQIIVGGCFARDYECDKVSTIINVLNGGSVSMPVEKKNGHLYPVHTEAAAVNLEEHPLPQASQPAEEHPLPAELSPTAKLQSAKEITLDEFVRKYDNKHFTSKTFDKAELLVEDDRGYSIEEQSSTRELVWQFMMKLVKNRGEEVMQLLNRSCGGSNPVFINSSQISEYRVAYKAVDCASEWAMCTNYSQYDWLVRLKKWSEIAGFDSRRMKLVFSDFKEGQDKTFSDHDEWKSRPLNV